MNERLAIGLMTGTSIDGIDGAAALISGEGLRMRVECLAHEHAPLGALAVPLRALASGERMTAGEIAQTALEFGSRLAEVAGLLAMRLGRGRPALIAVHGQTVFHQPPRSWQLVNAAPIARFGCPVVYDLRAADLASGGQGAPITPIADFVLFRSDDQRRVVVNLGGFCNVTALPVREGRAEADWVREVDGADVCACNHVLDGVSRRGLHRPFDEGGQAAASGAPNAEAVADLAQALGAQSRGGRSLGSGDEARAWIDRWIDRLEGRDLAASATEGVGVVIGAAIRRYRPGLALLAGGGARNAALAGSIRRACGVETRPTDDMGVPCGAREAVAMAALGALCADGVAITLPRITGVPEPAPLSGAWIGARVRLDEA